MSAFLFWHPLFSDIRTYFIYQAEMVPIFNNYSPKARWILSFAYAYAAVLIVLIRSLRVSLHRLWVSLLIEFGSETNKQNTIKNKFIRYLCFIAADFIHSCHHRLKMSSFSLEKNRFRSIDLTAVILHVGAKPPP